MSSSPQDSKTEAVAPAAKPPAPAPAPPAADPQVAMRTALHAILGFGGGPLKFNIDEVGCLAAAIDSHLYAKEHMDHKPRFPARPHLLDFAARAVTVEGLVLEFGVASGATINLIARILNDRPVYGFDSFQGLPEAWVGAPAGTFARPDLPAVPANTELVVGWFDRTLPTFLDTHPGSAGFIHVDCDLYSSTQTILTLLKPRIVPGTIIVFDEYFNYPGWRQHEYLAFQQFIAYTGMRYEYIGLSPSYEHVAVRMLG